MGSLNIFLPSKQDQRWKHIRFKLNSIIRARLQHPAVLLVLLLSSIALLLWRVNLFTIRSRGVIRFKVTTRSFAAIEAAKAAMPRTPMFHGWTTQMLQEQLPIWVLSLARSTQRRAAIAGKLKTAGVTTYEFIDAVDGGNASTLTEAELQRYTNAWKQHMWQKGQQHYRAKIAIDLTHYRLLERIAASNCSAIILEDDVLLLQFAHTANCTAASTNQQYSPAGGSSSTTDSQQYSNLPMVGSPLQYSASSGQSSTAKVPDGATAVSSSSCWLQDVLASLKEMPEDWEVLYLGRPLSSLQLGLPVSPHLRALRDATGTFGYVATPSFARKVLQAASSPRQTTWVDLIYGSMIAHREVQAYIVQPPLVLHPRNAPSTAAYAARDENVTRYEQLWGALLLG